MSLTNHIKAYSHTLAQAMDSKPSRQIKLLASLNESIKSNSIMSMTPSGHTHPRPTLPILSS